MLWTKWIRNLNWKKKVLRLRWFLNCLNYFHQCTHCIDMWCKILLFRALMNSVQLISNQLFWKISSCQPNRIQMHWMMNVSRSCPSLTGEVWANLVTLGDIWALEVNSRINYHNISMINHHEITIYTMLYKSYIMHQLTSEGTHSEVYSALPGMNCIHHKFILWEGYSISAWNFVGSAPGYLPIYVIL